MARDEAECGYAEFLDVRFHRARRADVLRQIEARPGTAQFAYVVTPNVDHVVRLQRRRSDLWPAYRQAWLTLCDSRILGWLARANGVPLSILAGSDLTDALFRDIVKPGDRIAILGGEAASVDTLSARFRLSDVVHYNPPMGFVHDPAEMAKAVAFIVDAHARFTFLAVGSPQQEGVARAVQRHGGATGTGLCVGASLEFLTGRQTRAPRAIRALSLEWMFRLLSNPRRMWRRYLVEGPQILLVVQHWRRVRAHG